MAGMPLFLTPAAKKITPPSLSAPLKLIKFCGPKTPKIPYKILRRRTGLVFA